jgi:ABC-type uncharacterized transport system permease subunit
MSDLTRSVADVVFIASFFFAVLPALYRRAKVPRTIRVVSVVAVIAQAVTLAFRGNLGTSGIETQLLCFVGWSIFMLTLVEVGRLAPTLTDKSRDRQ